MLDQRHFGRVVYKTKSQTHNTANIIKLLTILIIIFRLLLALKCAVRDIIQSQDWLVGILHDQILAILKNNFKLLIP